MDTTTESDLFFGSQTGCQGKIIIEVKDLSDINQWNEFASKHINHSVNPKIITIGAGPDTLPLASLFQTLRWPMEFWDFRSKLLNPKFKEHQKLVSEQDLANSIIKPDHDALAVLLMSHHYHYDLAGFKFALKNNAKFIGVLGPESRKQKLTHDFRQKNDFVFDESIIYGPVGTEKLGYDEEAIALSIASQLKKEFFH